MFPRIKLWRERHTVLAPAVFGLLSTVMVAAALAAWSTTSTSTGSKGAAGTIVAPTFSAGTSSAGAPSYPYQSAADVGDLTFTAVNPNPYPLRINHWQYAAGSSPTSSDTTNCPSAWFDQYDSFAHTGAAGGVNASVANPAYVSGSGVALTGGNMITVPSGTSQVVLPAAQLLTPDAPTGCEGVSVTGYKVTFTFIK